MPFFSPWFSFEGPFDLWSFAEPELSGCDVSRGLRVFTARSDGAARSPRGVGDLAAEAHGLACALGGRGRQPWKPLGGAWRGSAGCRWPRPKH